MNKKNTLLAVSVVIIAIIVYRVGMPHPAQPPVELNQSEAVAMKTNDNTFSTPPPSEQAVKAAETLPTPEKTGKKLDQVIRVQEKQRPVDSFAEMLDRCGAYGSEHGEPCVLTTDLWTMYTREKGNLPKDRKDLRRTVGYLTHDHLKDNPSDFDKVRRIVVDAFPADDPARYQFLAYASISAGKQDLAKKEYEYLERRFQVNEVPIGDLAAFYFDTKDYAKALVWEQRMIEVLERSSSADHGPDMLAFHRKRLEQIRQSLGQ